LADAKASLAKGRIKKRNEWFHRKTIPTYLILECCRRFYFCSQPQWLLAFFSRLSSYGFRASDFETRSWQGVSRLFALKTLPMLVFFSEFASAIQLSASAFRRLPHDNYLRPLHPRC
jgi:hypothetical protein